MWRYWAGNDGEDNLTVVYYCLTSAISRPFWQAIPKNYNYNCVTTWHVQYTSTVTLWEHARLELLITCLVNFLLCTDDLLAATSSDIATTWSRMWNSKQLYCGWLKKEDAYRTVGHYVTLLVQSACWNCAILKFVGVVGVGLGIIYLYLVQQRKHVR